MLRHTVELSLHTLLIAMRSLGLGAEPHPILTGGDRYIPPALAGQVDTEARDELSRLGLLAGKHLCDDFEATLGLIDRATSEYFAFCRTGQGQYGVLVAAAQRDAVTVLHEDGSVWLKPRRGEDHAGTLVNHLPEFEPAAFTGFSVRQRDLTDDAVSGIYDEPSASDAREVRELRTVLDEPKYGIGYLHVAQRAGGRRVEASRAVTYVDLDGGRVGMDINGSSSDAYINVFPGDVSRLATRLTSLLGSIR